MTDRAALQGQLVDIRNVGTHKSVKLTIHVPEELALSVTEMFGWPTAVNPVSVALARLVVPADKPENEGLSPSLATKERRRWADLSAGEQAGIRCNEADFQRFLYVRDAEQAAMMLRSKFKVASRKDIPRDSWEEFEAEYQLWQRASR